MKTVKDVDVKGKIVLVRADLNVPMRGGEIESDLRIRASLPTLEYLLEHGAEKVVVISHLGRPKTGGGGDGLVGDLAKVNADLADVGAGSADDLAKANADLADVGAGSADDLAKANVDLSLAPVAERLKSLLPAGIKVGFYQKFKKEAPERVILLENLRFDPREEENSAEMAQEIVDLVRPDLLVEDGFAVLHRAHTSTSALTKLVPTVAGLLTEKEILNLRRVLDAPERPLLLIVGGAKVEDKEPLILEFLDKADKIVVGGKIAADGYKANDAKIYVAEDFDEDAEGRKLDVGPMACAKIVEMIDEAKTVVWNGLMGMAEDPAYATASEIVAREMGEKKDALTVVCGGDTTGFVEEMQKKNPDLQYSLVSTGGGAALEFLLGKDLPGVENLKK